MEQKAVRSGETGGTKEGGLNGWTREQTIEAAREREGGEKGKSRKSKREEGE